MAVTVVGVAVVVDRRTGSLPADADAGGEPLGPLTPALVGVFEVASACDDTLAGDPPHATSDPMLSDTATTANASALRLGRRLRGDQE